MKAKSGEFSRRSSEVDFERISHCELIVLQYYEMQWIIKLQIVFTNCFPRSRKLISKEKTGFLNKIVGKSLLNIILYY